jgi:hypothetical protein
MVGNSSTAVSDCIRGATTADTDFGAVQTVAQQVPSVVSDFDTRGIFNDAPASPTLNLNISHKSYAWSSVGNRKYVIFEYKIRNAGATTINGLRAGIFADFDITAATAATNMSAYDATNKMGYIYDSNTGGMYAGIKLLTTTAPANFYALDNVAGGGGGVDANTGGYVTAEKWTTLSTQRLSGGPTDAMEVMSSGPFNNVLAGDTVKVAFAIIVGDNLADMQTSAVNAQTMYDGLLTLGVSQNNVTEGSMFVYPNPAQNSLTVDFGTTIQNGTVTVYNAMGQEVMSVRVNGNKTTLATDKLPNGNYFCKLVSDNKTSIKKFIIEK